jgi:predicted nuclease of predicted toxin-antitoxin system
MALRFLFDEHVNKPACDALRERGVDAVHVLDIGLEGASDPEVLDRAATEGRIVVTRNYRDFAGLVEAYNARQQSFPGVLFLAASLSQANVGGHVRGVEAWIAGEAAVNPDGVEAGRSSVAEGFGWVPVP